MTNEILPRVIQSPVSSKAMDNNRDSAQSHAAWPEDADVILENIRCNSIVLSEHHKRQYFLLLSLLKYFRIPIIIISAFASVLNIGLQPFLDQMYISIICCMLSLVTGLIGSIELFLQIQKKMENELLNSRDFYLNAIDIYKVLSLEPEHRNGDGLKYLDGKFAMYCKMIENSNIMDKAIQDQLAPIDIALIESMNSKNSQLGDPERRRAKSGTPNKEMNDPPDAKANEGFFTYFFGGSKAKSLQSASGNEFLHRRDNQRRDTSKVRRRGDNSPFDTTNTPMSKEEDSLDDDKKSISSEDRFDIYCKLLNKYNDIDQDIMEKLTPILSKRTLDDSDPSLEERVKMYNHLHEHLKTFGGEDILNKLKVILVRDFFHSKIETHVPSFSKENRFEIYKALMKNNVDSGVSNKVKQLLIRDMKQPIKYSDVDPEVLDALLTATHKKDEGLPKHSMSDIEEGLNQDDYIMGEDFQIGELTALNMPHGTSSPPESNFVITSPKK